ncbi:MAG: hypothetical protein FJW32_19245 [Acidobacteria bacterium]|nr:hypothetical protein [Acidobacteriota bacterium]
MFANRLAAFSEFVMPLIYTPGDNEWTDCHTASAGSHNPLERLQYLRNLFFPNDRSLGQQTLLLSRQSEDARFTRYVENAMWSTGPILFATVHVVGSNNNLGRNAENDREHQERGVANASWLATAFRVARENAFAGVILAIHANPGWVGTPVRPASLGSGFREFYRQLEDEAIVFQRPVLILMGDTHIFRIDKPMVGTRSVRVLDNVTRAEVPGDVQAHWLRIKVDPARRGLFSFEHEDVPQNFSTQTRP